MLLDEILYENVEDEQAEAIEKFERYRDLLLSNDVIDKEEYNKLTKDFKKSVAGFSRGYERDNDNMMYGNLDDMEYEADDLERKAKEAGIKENLCIEVWTDEDGNILAEAAVRQFKRVGTAIKRQYRCTAGPKKGKIVATPQACATRKDPRKVRHGRKVSRAKKGIRIRKSAITKRKAISKMVVKMNRRLAGKPSSPKKTK